MQAPEYYPYSLQESHLMSHWRIPATSAGLWLLGLVGRTSETSDGRYQRGRLMGYLTANPGCHFRALMAALEMSNGQITHHLKILEHEGRIWRRADGRLVRFYPYTSNLHPGVLDQDLLCHLFHLTPIAYKVRF